MQISRNWLYLRTWLALAAGAAAAAPGAAEPAPPLPVVRACGHHDYPPWNWHRDGRIVGACAAVAQRAIERLGYRVDFTYVGPWKRCQALIQSGKVDVNICSFRNAERGAYSLFAEPRMGQNRIAVFVRSDKVPKLTFRKWDDLARLRTGLVLGVSMGNDFDEFLEERTAVERVPEVRDNLNKLLHDRIDIMPFGWEAGLIEIERHGFSGRIVPLPNPALVGDLYVSVAKTSPLAARIKEIGTYFARPEYPAELDRLLDEYHRQYLEGVLLPDSGRVKEK